MRQGSSERLALAVPLRRLLGRSVEPQLVPRLPRGRYTADGCPHRVSCFPRPAGVSSAAGRPSPAGVSTQVSGLPRTRGSSTTRARRSLLTKPTAGRRSTRLGAESGVSGSIGDGCATRRWVVTGRASSTMPARPTATSKSRRIPFGSAPRATSSVARSCPSTTTLEARSASPAGAGRDARLSSRTG